MEIIFSPRAIEELQYWKKSGNKNVIGKIEHLLKEIQQMPFEGIGKPEALKHKWSGYWSIRITSEHCLVYKIENDIIFIVQLRYHY